MRTMKVVVERSLVRTLGYTRDVRRTRDEQIEAMRTLAEQLVLLGSQFLGNAQFDNLVTIFIRAIRLVTFSNGHCLLQVQDTFGKFRFQNLINVRSWLARSRSYDSISCSQIPERVEAQRHLWKSPTPRVRIDYEHPSGCEFCTPQNRHSSNCNPKRGRPP